MMGIREAHEAGDDARVDALAAQMAGVAEGGDLLDVVERMIDLDHPSVLVGLANILEARGQMDAAIALFDRYIEAAPHAADRAHVAHHVAAARRTIAMSDIRSAQDKGDTASVDALVARMVGANEDGDLQGLLGRILQMDDPVVLIGLAGVFEARQQLDVAGLLFDRYLDLAPLAADHGHIVRHAARIRREHYIRRAVHQARSGNPAAVPALALAAIQADRISDAEHPDLASMILMTDSSRMLSALASLSNEISNSAAAELAEGRLREFSGGV